MMSLMMTACRDELLKIAVSGQGVAGMVSMFGEGAARKALKASPLALIGKAPRPNVGRVMGAVSRKAPPPPKMLGPVSRKAPPLPTKKGPGLFDTPTPSPWYVPR